MQNVTQPASLVAVDCVDKKRHGKPRNLGVVKTRGGTVGRSEMALAKRAEICD
jgi:hypothetical protein